MLIKLVAPGVACGLWGAGLSMGGVRDEGLKGDRDRKSTSGARIGKVQPWGWGQQLAFPSPGAVYVTVKKFHAPI